MQQVQKLLWASILVTVAGSAEATPTVLPVSCTGTPPNEVCDVLVTCTPPGGAGSCTIVEITEFNANCFVANVSGEDALRAQHNDLGPNPVCEWTVTDPNDMEMVTVTIDSSDGLPVELQSFSVE